MVGDSPTPPPYIAIMDIDNVMISTTYLASEFQKVKPLEECNPVKSLVKVGPAKKSCRIILKKIMKFDDP